MGIVLFFVIFGVVVIAHEFGHVNQIRPGLKWVSTTEVTNNVYSVCARYKFYRENMPLERERCNDGNDNNVLGGRFNSYLNYGIIKGEQWLCQKGQDNMDSSQRRSSLKEKSISATRRPRQSSSNRQLREPAEERTLCRRAAESTECTLRRPFGTVP